MTPFLKNVSVSGANVVKFNVEPSKTGDDYQDIHINLQKQTSKISRNFTLTYAGKLLPEPMDNNINQVSIDAVELNVDSFWLPMDSGFNKLLTTTLKIDLEKGWQGVAAGNISETEYGFLLSNDVPSLDIAFALSSKYKITKQAGFSLYDLRTDEAGKGKLIEAIDFCVQGLNSRYGNDAPLKDIYFTINNRSEGGYARGNYIALTDISNTPATRLTQFVCHEIAHHWSSGGKFDTVENWLNEAFAEYVGMRMLRERFGEDAFNQRIEQFKKQIKDKSLGPIWTPKIDTRPAYLVSYRKGPLALHALEQKIGKFTFEQFLVAYMTQRTATTPAMLEKLASVTDQATVDWFKGVLAEQ